MLLNKENTLSATQSVFPKYACKKVYPTRRDRSENKNVHPSFYKNLPEETEKRNKKVPAATKMKN